MLQPNLVECKDCHNLLDLVCQIDEKLKYYAVNAYNNLTLMVCLDDGKDVMGSLLQYKSILTRKAFNPKYACTVPVPAIISRVKILLA